MVLLLVVRGLEAWALWTERASGREELLQFQPGVFVNRVVCRTLAKKSKRFSTLARKAGVGHLNPEPDWKLEEEVTRTKRSRIHCANVRSNQVFFMFEQLGEG
jgi:hypothetical protein